MKKLKTGRLLVCGAAAVCGALAFNTVAGISAFADTAPDLCEVNGVSYRYFDEALENWTNGTTLKLLENCKLSDLRDAQAEPLGVEYLSVTESKTLDLNGKTLEGTGASGVVRVSGKGVIFTLTDTSSAKSGKITGGKALFGGGVYVADATLNFKGGTVSGNTADSGGGVFASNATVNFDGGTVSGNTADFGGGFYLSESTLSVAANAAVTVEGNTAQTVGGGIYALGGGAEAKVDLGGGKVTGNSAQLGGGVAVWKKATLNLSGSAAIDKNTANGGAGVYVFGNRDGEGRKYGRFVMTGGSVSDNIGDSSFGGGVKVGSSGVFQMTAGKISGNTTQMNGGGVSVDYGGEASFGGTATVKDNLCGEKADNIFFIEGSSVTVENNFGGEIGVNCPSYRELSSNYTGSTDGITADDPDFDIYLKSGSLYIGSLVPERISIETMPTKLEYAVGEKPDITGMVVVLTYKDKRTVQITDFTFDDSPFTSKNVVREISYRVGNFELKADIPFRLIGGGEFGSQPFSGGFIAVVVLSALFVVAVIFVAIYTDGFKGKRKKPEQNEKSQK